MGIQLGRQPGRVASRAERPSAKEGQPSQPRGQKLSLVSCLPAADLRALPEPVVWRRVRREWPQAHRGRHRARRPGPLPRLADVCVRVPALARCISTTRPARPKSAPCAIRTSGGVADGVLGNVCGAAAIWVWCSMTRRSGAAGRVDGKRHRPPRGWRRILLDPHDPRVIAEGARGASPTGGSGPPSGPPVYALIQHLPGGAAATSGVPDHADGLVHPVAGGRRGQRRHDREDLGNLFAARWTHCGFRLPIWPSCSPRATPGGRGGRVAAAGGDALLHAATGRDPAPHRNRSG